MLAALRAGRPGSLLSVVPCKASGLRAQIEFRGRTKTAWALSAIKETNDAVALLDHEGRFVAMSASWPK